MDVRSLGLLFCEGSGLCDELPTRSEESYRMCVHVFVCVCVCVYMCVCLIVCDVEKSVRGGLGPI